MDTSLLRLHLAAACVAWILHFWISFFPPARMGTDPQDKPSDPLATPGRLQLALGAMQAGLTLYTGRLAAKAFDVWPDTRWAQLLDLWALPPDVELLAVGAGFFSAGLLLRAWSFRTLGRFFTFEIGIRPDHAVVNTGPYRWLRHPSYTGLLLLHLGLPAILASLQPLFWFFPGLLMVLLVRIRQEERMLVQQFGDAYLGYQRRTARLIPWIY